MSSEHLEQAALFEWAALMEGRLPHIERMFAVPNGGKRNISVARKMKAEGLKPGVPDIFLPVARGGYHGLFIEMKYRTNKPSDLQVKWLDYLASAGYCTAVCWGCDDAIETIQDYYSMSSDQEY